MMMIKMNIFNFHKKKIIGCIPDYTYGYYVYINIKKYAPEEHHIQSILKTKADII